MAKPDLPWSDLKRNAEGGPLLIGEDYLRIVEERDMPEQPPLPPRRRDQRAQEAVAAEPQPPMPPVKPIGERPLQSDHLGGIVPPDAMSDGEPFVVVDPRAAAPDEGPSYGRLTARPSESSPTLDHDPFEPDPAEPDKMVWLIEDVYEEMLPPGCITPTHVQRFAKGQRVLSSQVAHLRARWIEHESPRALETK